MGEVVMPRLSDSMEEGTILKWLKGPGDEVRRGEELVEIETDKATMTYEADSDGPLEIVAAEGDTLPIGALIARIGEAGGGGNGAAPVASPAPAPAAVGDIRSDTATERSPSPVPTPTVRSDGGGSADRPRASPLARRLAREKGIELTTLTGTGPGGRIVRADVEAAPLGAAVAAAATAPAQPAQASAQRGPGGPVSEPGTAKGTVTVVEPTRTQQVVARRMAESKATIPDFTLTSDVDMQACVELRAQLKEVSDPAPSFNDMVVKACALALRDFPRANGAYRDGRFELYSRVNVGVAVAAQDSLVVPTVFDADQRSLGEIARTTRALAERVRTGEVTPPELSGGTFTVSNLGMYGVTSFTAVINPPQAAILAVGALAERAVPRNGEIASRGVMPVTLACDHRILYGADAAQFLARVRELLEKPVALLL